MPADSGARVIGGKEDVAVVNVQGKAFGLCKRYARNAEIGGVSRVRGAGSRKRNLREDQLVGILGHYAASAYFFDSEVEFVEAREKADAAPHIGDGGLDLPGGLDVKTSRIRSATKPLLSYRLPVRPAELKKGAIYVCALAQLGEGSARVFLAGFAFGSEFPAKPCDEEGHPLRGAHVLLVRDLHPVWTIRPYAPRRAG